jgi:hypothetical protein
MINIKEDYGHKRPSETMMDFNSAVKVLELPNEIAKGSWHYTIKADSLLHFYVDMDKDLGRTLPSLLDNVRDYFLSIIPDFSEGDIKLSKNKSKTFSYHIDIPRVYGTPAEIHSHIKAIAIAGDWPEKQWDTAVYPTEQNKTRLYRMPHQAKPGANGTPYNDDAKHSINNGKTLDFILDYYPDSAHRLEMIQPVVYNSNKLASPKKNNETILSNDLSKIIDCLSVNRATDFETWRNVGFALKNMETTENENIKYWISFSKKYPLHDDDITLTTKYCGFKPKSKDEKAFKIGSLEKWAIADNKKLYYEYFPTKCLITEDDEYQFTEWEKTHCKILNPVSYLEYHLDNNAFTEHYIIRNHKSLEYAYCHKSILVAKKKKNNDGEKEMEKVSFIKAWMVNNDVIKKYAQIGIYPAPLICPPNIYNCWSSFRGDLIPNNKKEYPKELETFKKLISVLCNHEVDACVYLEKWIAQAIQYPANKTTVPTIISKQGAGKGTLIKLLTSLLGDKKVLSTTSAEVVFGKFNNQMLDAYLVNLDELSPKDVKDCEGKIKGLVTEPTISIDIKGVSSLTVKSYHRFINTTNNEFGVFRTEVGDRRNFIIRASDELIGNKEFFTSFNNDIIQNNDVVRYIYQYLKGIRGLENFHEASNIVKTSYGETLKECNRTDYDLWLEDFTNRNRNGNEDTFSIEYLLKDLNTFAKKDFNANSFGVRLLNIVPNAITNGQRTNKGRTKKFNWTMLRSHYKAEECLICTDEAYDEDENI